MKECLVCKTTKDFIDFPEKSNRCKVCISQYQKMYREKNKDKAKMYFKEYYNKNKEDILEKSKTYYVENKEKIVGYKKEYALKNKEDIKGYMADYYRCNKIKLDSYNKEYQKVNKKDQNSKRNLRNKKRRDEINSKYRERSKKDPIFRISQNLRVYIRYSIKSIGLKKKTKTQEILGCTFTEFKIYLESKFESWMSWENYGRYNGETGYGWDIDHIIPISTAKTEEDVIRLNHFSNLQPLCSYVNRYVKKDKTY